MSADQGDVRIVMTADANKVLAEWQKLLRAATQFNAALMKMTDSTKVTQQELEKTGGAWEKSLDSLSRKVVSVVARFGTLAGAIRLIRQEAEEFHRTGQENMDAQKAAAAFEARLLMATEREAAPGGLGRDQIRKRAIGLIQETGRDPEAIYNAMSAALSSKGGESQARAIGAVEMLAKEFPTMHNEEFHAYAGAIMDIMRVDPKAKPKEILGGLMETAIKSKPEMPAQFATTAGNAITLLMQTYGMDFSHAAALYSTATLTGVDPSGRRSATAVAGLAEQIRDATKRQLGPDASLTERLDWLAKDENAHLRDRLAGEMAESVKNSSTDITGERRMMGVIRGMLDPTSEPWKQYQQFAKEIPALGPAGERFAEQMRKDINAGAMQRQVQQGLKMQGVVAGERLTDPAAILSESITQYRDLQQAQRKSWMRQAYNWLDLNIAGLTDSLLGGNYFLKTEFQDRREDAAFQLRMADAGITKLSPSAREDLQAQIRLLDQILAAILSLKTTGPAPPRGAAAPRPKPVPAQRGN